MCWYWKETLKAAHLFFLSVADSASLPYLSIHSNVDWHLATVNFQILSISPVIKDARGCWTASPRTFLFFSLLNGRVSLFDCRISPIERGLFRLSCQTQPPFRSRYVSRLIDVQYHCFVGVCCWLADDLVRYAALSINSQTSKWFPFCVYIWTIGRIAGWHSSTHQSIRITVHRLDPINWRSIIALIALRITTDTSWTDGIGIAITRNLSSQRHVP